MKTKLKLNDLKVTSFVTELKQNEVLTVKGGGFTFNNRMVYHTEIQGFCAPGYSQNPLYGDPGADCIMTLFCDNRLQSDRESIDPNNLC